MPKVLINYNNTIIYKLCCKDPLITDIYIGSTTNFVKRKANHKCHSTNENSKNYSMYVYQFIRSNGGWNNWEMIEIIKIQCLDKRDSECKEREFIENLKASLNKCIPFREVKEMKEIQKKYYIDNLDRVKEVQKEYRLKNTDKKKESSKIYYAENADRISERRRKNYKMKVNKTVEDNREIVLIADNNE